MAENEPANHVARVTSQAEFNLRGCVLNREHVETLWRVACEGISQDATITVETERTGSGISSTITSTTISGVIEGVQKAALAGDPKFIDNLRLGVRSNAVDLDNDKYVSIRITSESVTVRVTGSDPEWVRGRAGRLKDLLSARRARVMILGPYPGWAVVGPIILIGAVAAFYYESYALNHAYQNSTSIVPLFQTFGITGLAFLVAALAGGWVAIRARTRLSLTPDYPAPKKIDKINLAVLIVGIIGIIVAIVAILIAHNDATHPHAAGTFSNIKVAAQ
jgi:hypothetical protein